MASRMGRVPAGAEEDRCPTGIAVAVGAVALIGTAAAGAALPAEVWPWLVL
jgi:hypothetical protein